MDRLGIDSERQDSSPLTNQFKFQMGQLVEQFQQIPATEKLGLLAEVRNLLLDLENVYNHNEITDKDSTSLSSLLSSCPQSNATCDDNVSETPVVATNSEPGSTLYLPSSELVDPNSADRVYLHDTMSTEFVTLGDYVDPVEGEKDAAIGANVAIVDVRKSTEQFYDHTFDSSHDVEFASLGTTDETFRAQDEGDKKGASASETLEEIRKQETSTPETTVLAEEQARTLAENTRLRRRTTDLNSNLAAPQQTWITRSRVMTKAKLQAAMESKTKSNVRLSIAHAALRVKSKSVAKRSKSTEKTLPQKRAKRKKVDKEEEEEEIAKESISNKEISEMVAARQKTISLHTKNELFSLQVALSTIEELNDKEKYYVNGIRVMLGAVTCRSCGSEYENALFFEQHTCRASVQKITCKTCGTVFRLLSQFQKHLRNHIRNDCKLCDSHFTKRKLLRKHERLAHGLVEPEKFYQCAHCDRKFIKRPSLYVHLREHADSKIVCMKCGLMCEDETRYKQHMMQHMEEANFHCYKCNESFVRQQQYEQHMTGHNKYDCTLCTTHFSTKKQMAKHRRITHGICTKEEKKHECGVCHKKFQRPLLLQIHKRVHTGENPVQCSQCEKNFRTPNSLARHLKTPAHLKACGEAEVVKQSETTSSSDRSFLCAKCGAKFFRKQGLLRHMLQSHSDERPYLCEFCDYKAKCKTNLKRHMELHKSERRYVCELCGSTFHALATLKEHHAYIHSEIRSFVCSECGKGFKGRSGLIRHVRSHSDARPYVCDCGQSYKRMSHLKRHMMAIHGTIFKSKRVQKIDSEEEQANLLPPAPPLPPPYPMPFQLIYDAQKDDDIVSDAITLPVTATNNFLIVSDPEHNTSEMAREVTLELTTTEAVGRNGMTHMPIPTSLSELTSEGILQETADVAATSMLHEAALGSPSCTLPLVSMSCNTHMESSSIPHDIVVSNMTDSLSSNLIVLPSIHPPHHRMPVYNTSVQTLPNMHAGSVSDVSTANGNATLESIELLQAELVNDNRKLDEIFW